MRDSDTGEVIGVGVGEDDSAALRELVDMLEQSGVSKSLVRSAAHQYLVAYRHQRGSEPQFGRPITRAAKRP